MVATPRSNTVENSPRRGKYCPKCQVKYDRLAEQATQNRLAELRRQREVAEKESKLGRRKKR